MTPALVRLVATRRFPALERKRGAGFWQAWLWSLGCTLLALVALVVSMPLWLIPPLVLVLPPLIWGWLTYRVLSFDVLAEHASADERPALLREHRWPLLGMGVRRGYLGAAPSLLWALSALALVLRAGADAAVDLALHAGVRVLRALVRALLRWPRCSAAACASARRRPRRRGRDRRRRRRPPRRCAAP